MEVFLCCLGTSCHFGFALSNISPWDMVTVLLSPLKRYYGMLPTPIPIHFSHTSPILSLLVSPSPFHSLYNSQLLFNWTQLTLIPCYCHKGFHPWTLSAFSVILHWFVFVVPIRDGHVHPPSVHDGMWSVSLFWVSSRPCVLSLPSQTWTPASNFHVWMSWHIDSSLGLVLEYT